MLSTPILYYSSVILPEFQEFKNFCIFLYYGGQLEGCRPCLPYDKLIKGYNNLDHIDKIMSESAINELLLWHEVKRLEICLKKSYNLSLEYSVVETPIDSNRMACTDQPVDSRKGYFLLNDQSDPLGLPFIVKCWYDRIPYI